MEAISKNDGGAQSSEHGTNGDNGQVASEVTDIERLHALSMQLLDQDDVEDALCEVMNASAKLLCADRASVQFYDEDEDVLRLVGTKDFDQRFAERFAVIDSDFYTTCAAVLKRRERVLVEDLESSSTYSAFYDAVGSYGPRAVLSTPLHGSEGQLLGVFSMYWHQPHRPSKTEQRLLDLYTQQAARQIERRRAQNERERLFREAESEREQLAEVFQQAPSFMVITSGSDHVFERANELYHQLVGVRDIIGKPVREALPEIEGQGFFELLDRVYQTGEPYVGTDTRVLLKRNPHQPPEERYLNFVYQPIRDPDGTITGIFVQGVDLTERKQAEMALTRVTAESERQRRLYEAIISSTPDLVYVFDLDYRFTFVNDALLDMWGRTLEESVGKTLLEVGYEPWHAEMHEREIDQVVATKQPIRGEVPFPHATLGERIYDYIFVPVLNAEGEVEAVAGTTRDITERRKMEDALKELNETLEDRVRERTEKVRELSSRLTMAEQEERRRISQILHDDLQQLLYGIQLKMSFVHRNAAKSENGQLLDHVKVATEQLDDAITTTRQLTVDLSPPVLQGEGLTDTLQWLQSQMMELHTLKVDIEAEHAWRIRNEDMRVLLFQIVRELLFNVVKHAETDTATVELFEEDEHLVIRVTDDGQGFEVEAAEADYTRGSGFGLFSVRERLNLFGGHMVVQSKPGAGTRVTVYTTVTPES